MAKKCLTPLISILQIIFLKETDLLKAFIFIRYIQMTLRLQKANSYSTKIAI